MLYFFQSGIQGVFDSNYYHSINWSLWTIRYEFSLYVAVGMLYLFRNNLKAVRIILVTVFSVLFITFNFFMARFDGSKILGMQGFHILNLGAFFVAGSLLASFKFEELKNQVFLAATVVVFIFSIYFGFYNVSKHIVFPILVILIGFTPLPYFSAFGKMGDPSYGIYIYSFPIQQTLVYFLKFNVFELMLYSVIISIVFGYLSWHLVEKKAFYYKDKLFKK